MYHDSPLAEPDKIKLSQPLTSGKIFQQQIKNGIKMVLQRLRANKHATPPVHDQRLASRILSRALTNIDVWESTRELLQAVAPHVERSLHYEEWVSQLKLGLQLCQTQDDIETAAYLNFHLGKIQRYIYADYQVSMAHYVQSEKLFTECGLILKQAEAMAHQAYVARLQEESSRAVELLDEAFRLLDAQPSNTDCPARAYGHFMLGVLAYDQLEWVRSESELRTALSLWRQLNDPHMIALSLSNLSLPLRKQEKYKEAIACYHSTIEQLESLNDTLNQDRLYMGLGNIYYDMNQPQQALEMYRKAEPITRKRNNPINLAHCWSGIGNAYREMEMWQQAEEAIQQAIEQLVVHDHVENVVDTMIDLALIFYYQGLLQKAEITKEEAMSYLQKIEDKGRREKIYKDQMDYLNQKIMNWCKKN